MPLPEELQYTSMMFQGLWSMTGRNTASLFRGVLQDVVILIMKQIEYRNVGCRQRHVQVGLMAPIDEQARDCMSLKAWQDTIGGIRS